MGHLELARHAHDSAASMIAAGITGHVSPSDVGAPAAGHAEFPDAFGPNWESAWIDLGGEG